MLLPKKKSENLAEGKVARVVQDIENRKKTKAKIGITSPKRVMTRNFFTISEE